MDDFPCFTFPPMMSILLLIGGGMGLKKIQKLNNKKGLTLKTNEDKKNLLFLIVFL